MIWLTGLYFIHTMGEIALSPIGLSMVNKLSPLRFASLMMGIWYLSTATANKFAGMLSGLYPEAGKVKSIFGYRNSEKSFPGKSSARRIQGMQDGRGVQ